MSLKLNIRHVEERDHELKGEVTPEEMELSALDELIRVTEPVRYDLRAARLEGGVLVQGRIEVALDCECARCLKPYKVALVLPEFACHLALIGEEAVVLENDTVDLTPFLREDILLEFPQHPLCEPDCGGLRQAPQVPDRTCGDSPWDELDKLKLKN